jgi:hypothetical protein
MNDKNAGVLLILHSVNYCEYCQQNVYWWHLNELINVNQKFWQFEKKKIFVEIVYSFHSTKYEIDFE